MVLGKGRIICLKENIKPYLNKNSFIKSFMDSKIKIFYAHSTRKDETNIIYEKVSETLSKNKKIQMFDPQDKNNAFYLDDKIFQQIEETDLFVADLTPD